MGDYRFIMVKAKNDRLAGLQLEWLRFLKQAGIDVALEKVERPMKCCRAREDEIV